MRIVHLSDIHLSKNNYDTFNNYYIRALIDDLKYFSSEKKIDIIAITGDLVDKGGHSLHEIDDILFENLSSFQIFEKVFIDRISIELNIPKSNFLFVPGNHDVDESGVFLVEEKKLESALNDQTITQILRENTSNFKHSKRIEKFKIFESEYHKNTKNYNLTNNQSTFFYTDKNDLKVGFILINDSWRCKSIPLWSEDPVKKGEHKHYVGEQQFHDGLRELETHNTNINVCLLHHDLNCFKDKDAIERILINKNIDVILFGHYHASESIATNHLSGGYLSLRCRASGNINEKQALYRVGYQIIDLKVNKVNQIIYRIYNLITTKFVEDTDTGFRNGVYDNNGDGFELHQRYRPKEKLNKANFKN
jgi:predicted phosphodiesterase